eukprot:Nk52_evm11s327 gene=Nk52_evmTU11s327
MATTSPSSNDPISFSNGNVINNDQSTNSAPGNGISNFVVLNNFFTPTRKKKKTVVETNHGEMTAEKSSKLLIKQKLVEKMSRKQQQRIPLPTNNDGNAISRDKNPLDTLYDASKHMYSPSEDRVVEAPTRSPSSSVSATPLMRPHHRRDPPPPLVSPNSFQQHPNSPHQPHQHHQQHMVHHRISHCGNSSMSISPMDSPRAMNAFSSMTISSAGGAGSPIHQEHRPAPQMHHPHPPTSAPRAPLVLHFLHQSHEMQPPQQPPQPQAVRIDNTLIMRTGHQLLSHPHPTHSLHQRLPYARDYPKYENRAMHEAKRSTDRSAVPEDEKMGSPKVPICGPLKSAAPVTSPSLDSEKSAVSLFEASREPAGVPEELPNDCIEKRTNFQKSSRDVPDEVLGLRNTTKTTPHWRPWA